VLADVGVGGPELLEDLGHGVCGVVNPCSTRRITIVAV
jgi:hypothetical protein